MLCYFLILIKLFYCVCNVFFWYIYLSLLLQELSVALCQVLTVLWLLVLNTSLGL